MQQECKAAKELFFLKTHFRSGKPPDLSVGMPLTQTSQDLPVVYQSCLPLSLCAES